MTSLLISLRVVTPIFLFILIGMLIRRLGWVSEATLKQMDGIGFRILLSTQLFYSVYRADRDLTQYGKPLLFSLAVTAVIFLASLLIFTLLEKEPRRRGPMIQCMIRYNFAIFGMAVVTALYGAEKTGLIAVLAAVIIPVTSTIAAILFEIYRGGKISPAKLLLNILKNPFLIGAVLGMVLLLSGLRLPQVLESVVSDISGMATPYCLIVLGGSIHLSRIGDYGRSLKIAVIGKSLLIPLLFIPLAVVLGFCGETLAALAVMLACPTAVSGFTLANQCGADGELAGQLVVITTLLSIVTMFLTLWILTAMAFI